MTRVESAISAPGEPLREATAWLARYQAFWDERYDRLDALLATLQQPQAG